jgi:hypothetical protein
MSLTRAIGDRIVARLLLRTDREPNQGGHCGDSARGQNFLAGVRNRRRRRLLLDQHPVELLEIAVSRSRPIMFAGVPRVVPVKPVLGHELKLSIGGRQRSLERRMEKVADGWLGLSFRV